MCYNKHGYHFRTLPVSSLNCTLVYPPFLYSEESLLSNFGILIFCNNINISFTHLQYFLYTFLVCKFNKIFYILS